MADGFSRVDSDKRWATRVKVDRIDALLVGGVWIDVSNARLVSETDVMDDATGQWLKSDEAFAADAYDDDGNRHDVLIPVAFVQAISYIKETS